VKIVFLSDLWWPFPGGAERYLYNLANQMVLRGHSVVALHSYFKAEDSPGIKTSFHDIGVRKQSESRHEDGWAIIGADLRTMQPDAIITHAFFAYEFEDELASCGIPIVQAVYNNRRLSCASLAVYVSEDTQKRVGSKPGDMVIIPPAFDDVAFEGGPAPIDRSCIGFIKPIPHKGSDFFYELAQAMPDRKFVVLRGEWNLIEDIRRLPNVHFMESVRDIREFYGRCRVMLVPSLYEDAGTIGQESAINWIPCISSDVMGLKETNASGIRLEMDAKKWSDAIVALDHDKYYKEVALRQHEGLAAFDWPKKFDQLSEAIIGIGGKR
jgi:glycosyltransferase involved in cell wall biosynthesis